MNTLIIDSALPLTSSSPRQRLAAALRNLPGNRENLSHATIDIWGTEWRARSRMLSDDRLLPCPRRSPKGTVPSFLREAQGLGEPTGAAPLIPLAPSGRRCARLRQFLRDGKIDRIILADPLLMATVRNLAEPRLPLTLLDSGLAGWSRQVARQMSDPVLAGWHRTLADLATPTPGMAQPLEILPELPVFEEFFVKGEHILTLATGFAWLDRLVLQSLNSALLEFQVAGIAPPHVVAIGFAQGLRVRFGSLGSRPPRRV